MTFIITLLIYRLDYIFHNFLVYQNYEIAGCLIFSLVAAFFSLRPFSVVSAF